MVGLSNYPGMHRKDLWDAIGMTPETWDDVRIGGAKLRKRRHPVGMSLASSNDPGLAWRGVLWSFGLSVQAASGEHERWRDLAAGLMGAACR